MSDNPGADHADASHVMELLPEYAGGRLDPLATRRVRAHLARCAACAAELRDWERIAGVEREATGGPLDDTQAPAPDLLARVFASIEALDAREAREAREATGTEGSGPPSLARFHPVVARAAHLRRTISAQARLLRPVVWLATAAGILLAVLYAATLPRAEGESDVLTFALPLLAAGGVPFLYGPETDAGFELALATPTSPRVILAARFGLLFGFDTALALTDTLALAATRGVSFWELTSRWFGPLALLTTLSLAVSLLAGPGLALLVAAGVWASRDFTLAPGGGLALAPANAWPAPPALLPLALALFVVALLLAPRLERLPRLE